jgi:hypothetical protein
MLSKRKKIKTSSICQLFYVDNIKKEENKNLLYMSTLLYRQHKKEENKNLLRVDI